jgi:general secretion pathway protein G
LKRGDEMKGRIRSTLWLAVVAFQTAACGTTGYNGCPGDSKCGIAINQILVFEAALLVFQNDTVRYPTTDEGLDALMSQPGNAAGWKGPYLRNSPPKDAWGRAYVYQCPGDHGLFDLYSRGSDGVEGTDDDIVNWDLQKHKSSLLSNIQKSL